MATGGAPQRAETVTTRARVDALPVPAALASVATDAAPVAPAAPRASVAGAEASGTVNRMVYLAIGISGVVFGALSFNSMQLQGFASFPWLSGAFWVLLVGVLASLGALSLWAPQRVLRVVALTAGAVQLGEILIWMIVQPGHLPAEASVPWVITFTGVPAVAVAAAAGSRVAWSYVIAVSALGGLLRGMTTDYQYPVLIGLQDGLYSLLLVSVFAGLMLATKQSAVRLDTMVRTTRREMAGQAARLARRRERLLINALVHDSVLSTLLMAGLGRTSADAVARHAQKTTTLLDSLAARESSGLVTLSGLELRLRETVARFSREVDVEVLATETAPPIPSDAAAAIVDAVAEALRNSMLHAGSSVLGAGADQVGAVARNVRVECREGGVRVVVTDDGVGFDPSTVPAQRLGIAQSIIGRMQRVSGGAAELHSTPGNGARVTLSWSPPVAPEKSGAQGVEYAFDGMQFLSRSAVRGALVLFAVVHVLLAFGDRDPRGPFLGEIVSVVAVIGAAVLVTRPAVYPLPHRTTVRVLALCAVTATMQLFQITPGSDLPFVHWHLGAITLILLVLVAHGRVGWAWAGYAVLLAMTVGWAAANGLTPADGLNLIIRQAGTLFAGSLFVLGMRRSASSLETLNRERTARTIEAATMVASLRERSAELGRVNSRARDLLDRLAGLRPNGQSQAPDPDASPVEIGLRAECLLVEASLRDAIRGRSLSVEPVINAAYRARVRGVEVSLIDDGDDNSDERNLGREATVAAVASKLDRMRQGKLTARILPFGRAEVATIVVESGEQRMLTVGADGVVHED